jgi:hypothetical protein
LGKLMHMGADSSDDAWWIFPGEHNHAHNQLWPYQAPCKAD